MVLDLLAFKVMSEDKVSFRVFIEKSELERLVLFQNFLVKACSCVIGRVEYVQTITGQASAILGTRVGFEACMQDAHAVCFLIAAATEA